MLQTLLIFSLLLVISTSKVAYSQQISSTETQPLFIELYSSQGCSSCPPAEEWLNKFATKESKIKLWKDIIPINFHVDYWDYLGWQDPFADSRFSARQWQYVQHKHVKQVATPAFIVNGKNWHGWFNGDNLLIKRTPNNNKLSANIELDSITVKYAPAITNATSLTFHIALLGFNQKTKVVQGENHGRYLTHDFVVIGYQEGRLKKHLDQYQQTVALNKPEKFHSDKQAIVVWVSEENNPKPIRVIADWLAMKKS